jgi:hypothetical protein
MQSLRPSLSATMSIKPAKAREFSRTGHTDIYIGRSQCIAGVLNSPGFMIFPTSSNLLVDFSLLVCTSWNLLRLSLGYFVCLGFVELLFVFFERTSAPIRIDLLVDQDK